MSHGLPGSGANALDVAGVRRIEHTWIPMADGVRLSARIWLPEDVGEHPVPAILEAIPYRKGDGTSVADEGRHPWFAANGYAGVRLDIRGSGDSEGVLLDEYLAQEQDDNVEAIAWLARQPWCSGRVGMIGYSWGGFAALQAAARRPPELGAIVTVDSTDDRYADDVHAMGGCVLGYYLLSWAMTMHAYATLPPDPAVVGERWRAIWHERLQGATPMIEPWLIHQLRDEYWEHGSVCEDYAAIECPVFAVSGWADGYRSAVLRLLAGLECPRKGLIGPWSHAYPMEAQAPGPAIGFLQECKRWFDHWLKGVENGVMDEPMLRAWIQDSAPPATTYGDRPGRWVAEPAWPSEGVGERVWHVGEYRLAESPTPPAELQHVAAERHGMEAGDWDPFGEPADLPPDQRGEDGLCLTFTSDPLEEAIDLLGVPRARLAVAVDRPSALLAVRLCDVDADGRSLLVTRGLLNLTHRFGHDRAVPCEPGEHMVVEVPMKAIGQQVPAGHRLRVAVSTGYWPWAWPSPEPVRLTLFTGSSALVLPVRPPRPEDAELRAFEPPQLARRPAVQVHEATTGDHTIERSLARGELVLQHRYPHLRFRLPHSGIEIERWEPDRFTIREGEPLSARVRCDRRYAVGRPGTDWDVRLELEGEMTADAEAFRVWTSLRAYDGAACAVARAWSFAVPRRGV